MVTCSTSYSGEPIVLPPQPLIEMQQCIPYDKLRGTPGWDMEYVRAHAHTHGRQCYLKGREDERAALAKEQRHE